MGPHSTTNVHVQPSAVGFAARWREVHLIGQEIGAMAALGKEGLSGELEQFPHNVEAIGGARFAFAQESLSDLDAMLRPGLAALRNIEARGQDTTAPALALWREFHAARSALLALASRTQDAAAPVPA